MLKVGLTGGIGSGKTVVAGLFQLLGIPVYVADTRAHSLMSSNQDMRKSILDLLGDKAYTGEVPDRQFIASRVFQNEELLAQLNAIVHPAVRRDFEIWSQGMTSSPYVMQEAAILFESGGAELMDENILVWAPEELRLRRVMERDKVSEKEVQDRMQHQLPENEKVLRSSFVIINDSAHSLVRQVLEIDDVLHFVNATKSA